MTRHTVILIKVYNLPHVPVVCGRKLEDPRKPTQVQDERGKVRMHRCGLQSNRALFCYSNDKICQSVQTISTRHTQNEIKG